MMYRLIANTPLGRYCSPFIEVTEEQFKDVKQFVKNICEDGTQMHFKSDHGTIVYLARGICQNSVFETEVKE